MRRAVICLLSGLVLSACSSMEKDMDAGLHAMKGQNIDQAFDVFGLPHKTQEVEGRAMYSWHFGGASHGAARVANQLVKIDDDDNCNVRVLSDGGKIAKASWGGDDGCEPIAEAIWD